MKQLGRDRQVLAVTHLPQVAACADHHLVVAKRADALLLDEPTSGLDPKASNEFSELILGIAREGAAILMATHDLYRAKETGTRIGIMREGVLRAQYTAAEISHTALEQAYLEQMQD